MLKDLKDYSYIILITKVTYIYKELSLLCYIFIINK